MGFFMKVITILITTGLLFTAAGQSTSTDEKKSETKKVTRTPDSPTIPPDATPLPDGSFRYVDKEGKKWIYRNTPFGVSKAEERPVAQAVARIEDDPAKSEDLGDSVRFSRPTPFGPKVWTKKKSDLDSYEKSIWDRDQQRRSGANQADTSKHDGAAAPSGDAKSRDTSKQD
jgi:hypothetical protein